MSSNKKVTVEHVLKILMRQLSGKIVEDDPLVSQVMIKGEDQLWAWDPYNKKLIPVDGGSMAYILMENYNLQNKTLIYCSSGDIICVAPDNIEEIGPN